MMATEETLHFIKDKKSRKQKALLGLVEWTDAVCEALLLLFTEGNGEISLIPPPPTAQCPSDL